MSWIDLASFVREAERYCHTAFNGTVVLVEMAAGASGPIGIAIRPYGVADDPFDEDEHIDESSAMQSGFRVVDYRKPF